MLGWVGRPIALMGAARRGQHLCLCRDQIPPCRVLRWATGVSWAAAGMGGPPPRRTDSPDVGVGSHHEELGSPNGDWASAGMGRPGSPHPRGGSVIDASSPHDTWAVLRCAGRDSRPGRGRTRRGGLCPVGCAHCPGQPTGPKRRMGLFYEPRVPSDERRCGQPHGWEGSPDDVPAAPLMGG